MNSEHAVNIHLIKAGPTAWDDQRRLQGDTDLPMLPQAMAQWHEQATAWQPGPLSCIHCPTNESSRQTANIFASLTHARIREHEPLHDVNLGLWQGLTDRELRDRHGRAYHAWRHDPTTVAVPEGEPIMDAVVRICRHLLQILRRHPADVQAWVLRPLALSLVTDWLTGQDLDHDHFGRELPIIQTIVLPDHAEQTVAEYCNTRISV